MDEQQTYADELRAKTVAAKSQEEVRKEGDAQKKLDAIEKWYRDCRAEANKEAKLKKREARIATGYHSDPEYRPAAQQEILDAVVEKLTSDGLRARIEVVSSKWYSEDTGEDFTKKTVVFVITW